MSTQGTILVVGFDEVVSRKVTVVASALGRSHDVADSVAAARERPEPAAVVIDLDLDGASDAAAALRARWPHALIAGFVSLPDPARWQAALDTGYDLVATRGTIATQLRAALETWDGPPTARRFRLFDAADVVGRLGVVARLPETPVGAIAVYQISRALLAAGDTCPHAGARLSEGELSEGVITCPRHGSRFELATGERVRGPADDPIPVYRVVVAQGVAYLEY